jgi:fumarylacetoacetate (FAA) hydrolase
VHLDMMVHWNHRLFGRPNGGAMDFHFGQLIAHAARTRRLRAGTLVGSGTVSNDAPEVGSACVAERRVIEKLADGHPRTSYLAFGDHVRIEAHHPDGREAGFGAIAQRLVQATAAGSTR